jgi:S1-C subfamily serine protease
MGRVLLLVCFLMVFSGCGQRFGPYVYKSDTSPIFQIKSSPLVKTPKDDEVFKGSTKPVLRVRSVESQSESRVVYGSGSGFVVNRGGKTYIVTAYHVVSEAILYEFLTHDRKPLEVEIAALILFPSLDAALFEVTAISAKIAPLEIGSYRAGAKVTALGYPKDGDYAETKGSSVRAKIESTAPIEVGMSGGPVLDENKKAVGIVSMKVISDGEVKSILVNTDDVFYLLDTHQSHK